MSEELHPVVVAFDGSEPSKAAIRAAATLFPGRRLLVASVWEPGLAMATMPAPPGSTGLAYPLPSADEIATVDRLERDHASSLADAGVQLATSLGADAVALAVPDGADIAETVVGIADDHHAAAIVVGSRGRGGIKAMFGSTSRRVLHDARRPVVVVRGEAEGT